MGTDFFISAGHEIRVGNNTTIGPEPDTRQQADELYVALSIGSNERPDTADMVWSAYWEFVSTDSISA